MKTQRINKYVWTFYTKTSENTLWVWIQNIRVPRFPLLHRFLVSFRKIIRPIDEISKKPLQLYCIHLKTIGDMNCKAVDHTQADDRQPYWMPQDWTC